MYNIFSTCSPERSTAKGLQLRLVQAQASMSLVPAAAKEPWNSGRATVVRNCFKHGLHLWKEGGASIPFSYCQLLLLVHPQIWHSAPTVGRAIHSQSQLAVAKPARPKWFQCQNWRSNIWIHVLKEVWNEGMERRCGTEVWIVSLKRYGTKVWNGGMDCVWPQGLFRIL